MAWSKDQKQVAAIAAKAAGLDDESRKLVLRQIPGNRAVHEGRVSSTSPRLTNGDFEYFMAVLERTCGGMIPGHELRGRGHWAAKADDALARMRRKIERDIQQLSAPGYLRLEGFIKRQTGKDQPLEQCDAHELYQVLEGVKVIARRHGVNQ